MFILSPENVDDHTCERFEIQKVDGYDPDEKHPQHCAEYYLWALQCKDENHHVRGKRCHRNTAGCYVSREQLIELRNKIDALLCAPKGSNFYSLKYTRAIQYTGENYDELRDLVDRASDRSISLWRNPKTGVVTSSHNDDAPYVSSTELAVGDWVTYRDGRANVLKDEYFKTIYEPLYPGVGP